MEFNIIEGRLYIDNVIFELNGVVFENELGKGRNAKAFLVRNKKVLDRKEVVKIWIPREDRDTQKQFVNEIRKNALLTHNNIASIYDAEIQGDVCFCRMEYIPGITLRDFLKSNPDFVIRYTILERILSIMKYVYENGKYHGDLHSGNIVLNCNEIAGKNDASFLKIIDFGTSILRHNINDSHKRDSKLLYNLCYELLPELQNIPFINFDPEEHDSAETRDVMVFALRIVFNLVMYNDPKK